MSRDSHPLGLTASQAGSGELDDGSRLNISDIFREIENSLWVRCLSESQLERVLREIYVRQFAGGSLVVNRQGVSDDWVGVLRGMVRVNAITGEGCEAFYIGALPGRWLGEGPLLRRETRSYEIRAVRESLVAFMPRETFAWLCDSSTSFNKYLLRKFDLRLSHFVLTTLGFRSRSLNSLVAASIVSLIDVDAQIGLDVEGPISLGITQSDIGELCGLSRQTAGRALHSLERLGLVRTRYGELQLLDVEGLEVLARTGDGV